MESRNIEELFDSIEVGSNETKFILHLSGIINGKTKNVKGAIYVNGSCIDIVRVIKEIEHSNNPDEDVINFQSIINAIKD